MSNKAEQAIEIAEKITDLYETNRLLQYEPYEYQKRFHDAKDISGRLARQRLLMAANKTGKTFCGASEMAFHLTGRYPEWWTGAKFKRPITAWAAGNTTANTRDIVQAELLGEPGDEEEFGKGAIPKEFIVGTPLRQPGVPNAFQSLHVKHISGRNSKLIFKSYEQGKMQWMGKAVDVTWLDEEPPQDIYSQALRAALKSGGIVFMTFTPESGMTEVVTQFMTKLGQSQALYHATWDDAIQPFPLPEYWPKICGLDFGWDHPTAVVWLAWDRDTDTIYVYDCYRKSAETPVVHSAAIRERGKWIPVVWPHDGSQHDKGSGKPLAELYRKQGLNMIHKHFQNPDGGISVEPGIMDMLQRMQTGRFKVFNYLNFWFEELRMYHRKDGKIVKVHDDLMSATRYASQSLVYASTGSHKKRPRKAISDYDYYSNDNVAYA